MSITTEESAGTRAMPRSAKSLSAYLNDHLAGETLGLELATRASVEHNGTPLGTFLLLLSWELEEDRDSFVELWASSEFAASVSFPPESPRRYAA